MMMPAHSTRPPNCRDSTTTPRRTCVSHTTHMRELEMVDGRKLLLDRRSIAFICEVKPEDFGGKQVTVVPFKTIAKACPVTATYQDLKAWWRGGDATTGKDPQP